MLKRSDANGVSAIRIIVSKSGHRDVPSVTNVISKKDLLCAKRRNNLSTEPELIIVYRAI